METAGGGFDVIVDIGRLSAANAPTPLLASADAVLLALRPTLPSVRAAAVALAGLTRPGVAPVGLLPIGQGSYAGKELAAVLHTSVVAGMPDDPRTADVLSTGGDRHNGRLLRVAARAEPEVWRMVEAGRAARNSHVRQAMPSVLRGVRSAR
jgi:hypothetical protein